MLTDNNQPNRKTVFIIDNGTNYLLFERIAAHLKLQYNFRVIYITLIKNRVNYFKNQGIESIYINLKEKENNKISNGLDIIKEIENKHESYRLPISIRRDRILRWYKYQNSSALLCKAAVEFKQLVKDHKPDLVLGEISWAIEELFYYIAESTNIKYRHLLNLPGNNLRVAAFDAMHTAEGTHYLGKYEDKTTQQTFKSYQELCQSVKNYKSSSLFFLKNIKIQYSNNDYRQSVIYRLKKFLKYMYKYAYLLFEYLYHAPLPEKSRERKNIIMVLHVQPESTPDYVSTIYADQFDLAKRISDILSSDEHLYIKEHPNAISIRNLAAWAAILHRPNVHLLRKTISGNQALKHFDLVISVAGTALYEASKLGIPAVSFSKIFYNNLPNVINGYDASITPAFIRKALSHNSEPITENEGELFLADFGLPAFIHDARIAPEVTQKDNIEKLCYIIHKLANITSHKK